MNHRSVFLTTFQALFFFAIPGPARSAMPAADHSVDTPLRVTVIRPVYRQNIYATENLAEVVYRVDLASAIRGRTHHLVCRLLSGDGREVRRSEARLHVSNDLRFEAASLAPGQYTLHVRAVAEDRSPLAEASTVIRKLPRAPGSEVRIDADRNILVNGKPVVLIGWYGTVPVADPRPEVVALQNVQTPVVVEYPNKQPVSKAFRERGVYSIVSLETGRLHYAFQLWRKPGNNVHREATTLGAPSDECRGYLKQMVELLRDEPGLLGYYVADEPEINNVRAEYLESLYRLLCELDPYHPVIITNDTLEGIEKFGYRACDILSPDPYSPKPGFVSSFMEKVAAVWRPGQAVMLTPWHSAGHTHFTTDYGSDPPYPYRVTRGQYLAAVAYGCRGFTGYTSDFFLPEPVLRFGLPHIWREVRFLEPATAAPPPAERMAIEPGRETAGWIRRSNEHIYVILVNNGSERKIAVRHPLFGGISQLTVVGEGPEIALQNGAFTDELAEGAARLYSTDPRAKSLPTIAEVERQIAEAQRALIKPGNLLHASRGVRARASDGFFAPWFSQYYYYAINGVTDDIGWQVTHAELPQWLELALPEEKAIGRVIVYTPNLRDYDLEFRDSEGGVRVAEVRGNTATVAEHSFQPAVPALKFRIVARAVRDGASPARAMVREIEAYADPGEGAAVAVRQAKAAPAPAPDMAAVDFADSPGPAVLWSDDFSRFAHADKYGSGRDDAWVFNPQDYSAAPKAGGIVCTSTAAAGYSAMSRILPYDPAYRFFQVKISAIEGDGYRFGTVGFGESSGRLKCRGGVLTSKPGIYTVDTHYVHDDFHTGKQRNCFVTLYTNKGVRYTYDWLRLGRVPRDGLAVTLADGAPLPPTLQQGNEVLLRLCLEKPAVDATVEVFRDFTYTPVRINGEPYVQLLKAGKKDGRLWSAVVKLGPGTDKCKAAGYPVLFRAVVTGGAVRETSATVFVDLE